MIVSLAAGFAVSRLTPTPPLTQEGLAVLGVFLSSLMMWITISIDWPSLITLFLLGPVASFWISRCFSGRLWKCDGCVPALYFCSRLSAVKDVFCPALRCGFCHEPLCPERPLVLCLFPLIFRDLHGTFHQPICPFCGLYAFLEDIYEVLQIKKKSQTGNMLMLGTAFCISLSSGMTAIGHVWPTLLLAITKRLRGLR